MDYHIRGPMGKARVQVNDRPPIVRDAWFSATWGGYRQTDELARDLPPGKHRVTIEILPEKNRQSTGHEYHLFGLGQREWINVSNSCIFETREEAVVAIKRTGGSGDVETGNSAAQPETANRSSK